MPAISRIRLCNIIYENGGKRYNDQIFHFDGQNSAILLENGGGKTVFIQAVLQGIIPHINMADRKIKDTLSLDQGPAHIAIEWILNEQPRRYGVTSVSLFQESGQLNSLKYTYEYSANDENTIEDMPFKIEVIRDGYRPAARGEISEYYQRMAKTNPYANVFSTIQDYGNHLENVFKIIPSEWRKVAVINSGEGNVDEYFNRCKTTEQLLNNLLIPVVEEAIEGDSSVEFAKTFEKQRDHFKKNRILHDKIEQSKGIKQEIDEYVEVYKKFDVQLNKARKVKGKATAITRFVEEELKGIELGRSDIEKDKEELAKEVASFEVQKVSHQILVTTNKMEEKMKETDILETKEENLLDKKDATSKRRQNIQLSKVKRSINELENEMVRLNMELENAEKELPMEDVQTKLNENSANIKGHFGYKLEQLKLEKVKRQNIIDGLNVKLKQQQDDIDLIKTKEAKAKENVIKSETTIEICRNKMDDIYDRLFESQIGAQVDEHLSTWTYEVEKESNKYTRLNSEHKELMVTTDGFIKDKETVLNELQQKHSEQENIKHKLEEINDKSGILIERVNNEGIKISNKDLIYTKEESIKTLLKEKEDYYDNKKQTLLIREFEVMSKSLLKNVMHPSIIQLNSKMKEKVDFITLGQDYLYQLVDSTDFTAKELLVKYPFFAMTLVTNRSNKEKVFDLLENEMDQLQAPLFVMTIEDISNILKIDNEDKEVIQNLFLDNAIIPGIWNDSLTSGYLDNHNDQLEQILRDVQSERKSIEEKWAVIKTIVADLKAFLAQYSYEEYIGLSNLLTTNDRDIQDIKRSIENTNKKLEELESSSQDIKNEVEIQINIISELQANIALAKTHEDRYQNYLKLREEEETYRTIVSDFIYQRKDMSLNKESLMDKLSSEKESIKEFEFEERKIIENPLYVEVEAYEAICANVDIKTLINERNSLKLRLAGLSVSREAIVQRIDEQTKLLSHYLEQLNRLTKEAEFAHETIDVFYEHEEDDLFDLIVNLKRELKELAVEHKKHEKAKWALETEKNLLINDLKLKGNEPFDFECDRQYIPTRMKVFEGTIRDSRRKIERIEKEFTSKIFKYNSLLTQLKIKDGSYNFLVEEPMNLSRKDKDLLNNDLDQLVQLLFKELSETGLVIKGLSNDVARAKATVLDYCRDHVDDYRLKEAITNGLIDKDNYDELLIYQERMTDIINKTVQLANDDKRESDTELITFLSHLLTYVKTIVHELNILQKKTIIELESGNKQIFVFDIPEYEDELAKDALRLYIDEMIELFEEEEQRDDEHLRNLIEDRLSVKNLIPVILSHVPIKIKCRKVTNDLQINKAPMSWEFSNKWSGGEKWSKNMTLFLGILNYLAEKKQHLSPNQKRNRTVILDNPFGKASSKHVLDPVFFIAEKLGFQIIALTAHAEGQFISDYFPVVYSLRLRETNQENKLLMTSERVLNYTYLRERAPASITRLQEVEQLDLFKI